jgi:hypothetical protein
VALAGVAVFTVTHAGCADSGRYVQQKDGTVELVGSCLDPADLPSAPAQNQQQDVKPAKPAVHELSRPAEVNP